MKISKSQLRTDNPPIIELEDGCCNIVLACHSDNIYCETNTYIPRWTVSNTKYYNKNPDDFIGWIELEDTLLPDEFRNNPTKGVDNVG